MEAFAYKIYQQDIPISLSDMEILGLTKDKLMIIVKDVIFLGFMKEFNDFIHYQENETISCISQKKNTKSIHVK